MNGIINVLKPSGMTSHDVVSFIRKKLRIKKVGHTGTLDPNAAGVLPICIGKATKVIQYLNEDKSYRCELTLGTETDTEDKYGSTQFTSTINVSEKEIIDAIHSFIGTINQIPPMYSALKHHGKKLYEIAREGKEIERPARTIHIYDINIIKIDDNKRILFDVKCSKGTYIRTLCKDIGRKLRTYGHMSFLLRTKAGSCELNDAYTIEEIQTYVENHNLAEIVLPMDYPLYHLKEIHLDKALQKLLLNGRVIFLRQIAGVDPSYKLDELMRVYCDNRFIGVGNIKQMEGETVLKMKKVLT